MLSNEAILYYANHPVEFVQDILKADPDPEQKKILRSLVTNQMTSVRSGHGIGKSAVRHGLLYGSCVLTHIRRYHAQPRHSISCSISFGLRSVNGNVTIKRWIQN